MWLVALAVAALAIWLARGRRRLELRALAIGLVLVGLLLLAVRRFAGDYLVDELAKDDAVKPAAHDAWSILTQTLADRAWVWIVLGVVTLLGVWFVGESRSRRTGAPRRCTDPREPPDDLHHRGRRPARGRARRSAHRARLADGGRPDRTRRRRHRSRPSNRQPRSAAPRLEEATLSERPQVKRDVLPIPDTASVGLTTYDAKDPDTSFPPITQLRPPDGAPNVLVVLIDDVGFGASSAFGGADRHAERRATGLQGAEVQPLPHDGALLAHARGASQRPQPPHRRHGRHHGDRDLGARVQLDPAEHVRAARRDAEAERLLDGAVRQVPRGAGLGDEPDGAVPRVAHRQRLRVLLRLHRRRGASVLPGHLRRHRPGRAREDARGGLPLHGRHDGQGDQVGAPAEGADAGQAVLRLLRSGCDACTAPRHARMGRQVQGRRSTTAGTLSASGSSPGSRSWA